MTRLKQPVEKQQIMRKKCQAVQEEQELPEGPGTTSRSTTPSLRFRSPEHERHYDWIKEKAGDSREELLLLRHGGNCQEGLGLFILSSSMS